jgi:hypothetical protein
MSALEEAMYVVRCRSEQDRSDRFLEKICQQHPGILIANYLASAGRRGMEVDGILISRNFVCTVEVKYSRLVGRLHVNPNMDWTINGKSDSALRNPTHQARAQAQQIGAILRKVCPAVGTVTATVLVGGNISLEPVYRGQLVHVAVEENFHQCLRGVSRSRRPLRVDDVNAIMQELELASIPQAVLVAEGFDGARLQEYALFLQSFAGREEHFIALCRATDALLSLELDDLEGESMGIPELRQAIREAFPLTEELVVQQLANFASFLFEIPVFGDLCVDLDGSWVNRFAPRIADGLPNTLREARR